MSLPTRSNWSLWLSRDVAKWGKEFTEHWTYQYDDGNVTYKLRVVGPHESGQRGEVFREDGINKSNVPGNVRTAFQDTFGAAAEIA